MGRKAKRRKVYLKQRDRWEAPSEGGEDLFSVAPAFLTCPPLSHLTGWLYILLQTQFLSKDTALSKLLDLSPFLWSPPWKQKYNKPLSSLPLIQFSSVAQSCPTLCDPMNLSMPDLPVHHQLPEFTQTHVHRVSDAIQPSHPLSSPSPPAPNPSQHQGLFQWVNSLHEIAKVLEFQPQHQSFQWTPRTGLL